MAEIDTDADLDAAPGQPGSRGERKQRTRALLLDAALQLMRTGRGFASLSLREITRAAGLAPAAFYRHFEDLDALGLALVAEGGVTLRRLLREARRTGIPPTRMMRSSVQIYMDYLEQRPLQFLFIASERSGGSARIRSAIRAEEQRFALEMAQDLRALGQLGGLSPATRQMVCGLVVSTMMNAASDILDLPPGQPEAARALVDGFVRQLRLLFLGARLWQEDAAEPQRQG